MGIVERLRELNPLDTDADGIERLRKERDELLAVLVRVKSNLMHTRLFGHGTLGEWRRAATTAEGDVEEAIASAKGGEK